MSPRIILVEDEALVAMMMEDLLTELGFEVVASFSGLAPAMDWLGAQETAPDGAVLDVNLSGEMVFPLADALAERQAPFVFVTGYGKLPEDRFPGAPVLHKPVDAAQLEPLLRAFVRGEDEEGGS